MSKGEQAVTDQKAARTGGGRDGSLDWLRWLCLFGVLMQHSKFGGRYSASTVSMIDTLASLTNWCVLGFFFVSGAVSKDAALTWSGFARRTVRLLGPYLFASAVSYAALAVCVRIKLVNSDALPGAGEAVRKVLTGEGIGPHLYFLSYLWAIALVVGLMRRFAGPVLTLFLAAAGAVATEWLWPTSQAPTGHWHVNVPLYVLAYAWGAGLQDLRGTLSRGRLLALGMTLLAAVAAWASGICPRLVLVCIPPVLLACLRMLPLGNPPAVNQIGAIYLWHEPILMPGLSRVFERAGIDDLPNLACTIVATAVLSVFANEAVKRLPGGRLLVL